MKKYFLVIPFLLSLPTAAFASNACNIVFNKSPASKMEWKQFKDFRPYKNQLNPQSLKAAGFRIENDMLYEIEGGNDRPVGTVKVSESSHLFEWTDKEIKESWSPGGLTDAYMQMTLKEPAQAAGKGFYVSMDPIDSADYGNALTTFKASGPILVLEVTRSYKSMVHHNTAFVTRLANAGIDGLRYEGYEKTWLSMISNRHLREVTDVPTGAVLNMISRVFANRDVYLEDIQNFYLFLKHVTPEVWKTVPENNVLRKIFLREEVKDNEFSAFLRKVGEGIQIDFLSGLLGDFTYSKNPAEALHYLNLLKDHPLLEYVGYLMGQVSPKATTDSIKQKYWAILLLFDLKSVATTKNLRGMKNVGDLYIKNGRAMTSENKTALEAEAKRQKAGSIKHDASDIFYDLEVVPGYRKTPQIEMLSAVLNEWTANAKNDVEFISRSRWSLEFFFRLYPQYRVPLTPGEAVP